MVHNSVDVVVHRPGLGLNTNHKDPTTMVYQKGRAMHIHVVGGGAAGGAAGTQCKETFNQLYFV